MAGMAGLLRAVQANPRIQGTALVVISLVPLAFFCYTLFNLGSLQIPVWHPRVLVESGLFLLFLIAGLLRLRH